MDDGISEEDARLQALDEASKIRADLIANRRKLVSHIAGQPKPGTHSMIKLRETQDAIILFDEIIESEGQRDR